VKLKSDVYLESGFNLFVESDPLLARKIHQRTEKPVLCPKLGRTLTQDGE
jgi:hypothetical protein